MGGNRSRAQWLVVRALVRLTLLLAATRTIAGSPRATGAVAGSALESGSGRPAVMLRLRLTPEGAPQAVAAPASNRRTMTDDAGEFIFEDLQPGLYRVEPDEAGESGSAVTGIRVEAGEVTHIEPIVTPPGTERVVVRATREASGAPGTSHLLLTRAAIDARPASLQDPLRALTGSSGIGTQNDFKADLQIRGGDAADTAVLSDGMPLQNAYHFSGTAGSTSTINDDLVGDLEVWSGGFSSEYGDALAGVVDVGGRSDRPAALTGEVGAGTTLAHATLRGPMGAGAWTLSGRASDLGLYADRTGDDEVQAISFHDRLAGFDFSLPGAGRLVLTLQDGGSDYAQDFGLHDRASQRGIERGARLRWEMPIDAQTFLRVGVGHGTLATSCAIGAEAGYDQQQVREDLRLTLTRASGGRHLIETGIDLAHSSDRIAGTLFDADQLRSSLVDEASSTSGSFVEDLWRPTEMLAVRAGARMDRFTGTGESAFSPRVSIELRPEPGLALRFSAGRFVQFPRPQQSFLAGGAGELKRQRADHFILGLERSWGRGARIAVEAYRKDLVDPIAEPTNLYVDLPELLARFDRGRIHGVDLTIESADGSRGHVRFDGSYMVAREERDGRWFDSNTDQRATFGLSGGWRFGRAWDLSAGLRYASGLPYSSVEPWASGSQVGVSLGRLNAARLPAYYRLDLRLARSLPRSWGRLRFELDLLNLTDRRNVRSIEVAYDETTATFYRISHGQSPFLPVFSLTAEF